MGRIFIYYYRPQYNLWLLFFLASVFTTVSSILKCSTFIVDISSTMPVITQSKVKGGLQKDTTFVPLPSSCPTCCDAIATTSPPIRLDNTLITSVPLPDLVDQVPSDSSSSASSDSTVSSLDSDFKISKFQKLKVPMQNFETADSIYYLSHNCIMESDCAEAPNYLI
jgi:hypothetical protein